MGCPDSIRAALEGLSGVTRVDFDNKERAFLVEAAGVGRPEIEAAVRAAGDFEVVSWQEGVQP
jgi:copper chaperone CopZ